MHAKPITNKNKIKNLYNLLIVSCLQVYLLHIILNTFTYLEKLFNKKYSVNGRY